MKRVYGDFESFFENKTYTLKGLQGLTPYEYILDPRWETIGCGIALGDDDPIFYPGDAVAGLLQEYPRPWAFISYNALFDASILAYRYSIYPDVLIDAMGLVRAVLLHKIPNGRVSLDNVTQFLGLPKKDGEALVSGWHLADYQRDPVRWARLQEYCLQDTVSCRSITQALAPIFPRRQLWVMSAILKMCTQPNFWIDHTKLTEHLTEVVADKEQLLQRVGLTRGDLLSNDKFVDTLIRLGVDPPKKISPSTGLEVYATSKTDLNYLLDHDDPDVQALVAARTGVKSTQEERRTERFISFYNTSIRAFGDPWMPVPLKYGAAHTHRFGGEWKINMQNLPTRMSNKLREALIAPPDHVILEVDASQIQARLTGWLAGEHELLDQFEAGHDVYCWFASDLFKRTITKADIVERFIAKQAILGLGFQMGASKFLWQLTRDAALYDLNVQFTLGQCEVWVDYYRSKFRYIRVMWYDIDKMLDRMVYSTVSVKTSWALPPSYFEGTDLVLPTGLRLYYDNLRQEGKQKVFDYGREKKYIYGGKFVENHAQALDIAHCMDAAYRIEQRMNNLPMPNIPLAHQMHDALIYVCPKEFVRTLGVIMYEEMRTQSYWEIGLPLDAEVKIGLNYGDMRPVNIAKLKEIV